MSNYPSHRWEVVIGVTWSLCAVLLAVTPTHADESHKGTLVITVQDEDGSRTSDTNIYIFGGGKELSLMEVRGASANPTFELPAGSYCVYAGYNKALADTIDHYSTPEARIVVTEGETTPVILTLQHHIPNTTVTEATLRHMGLNLQLAQYFN